MAVKKMPNEVWATWLRVRGAWGRGKESFDSLMATLSGKQNEQLYDIVRYALYKDSYVQVLREKPELKQFLKSDEDRMCMIDIYEILSYRLRRSEPPPKIRSGAFAMRGDRIGRAAPTFGY